VATIDETIYVAKPDVLGLDRDNFGFEELHESLREEAAGATGITILGGYMSPDYVLDLCDRVPRRRNPGRGKFDLRIAIGFDRSRPLARQWDELRELKADLQALGFRSAVVAMVLHGDVHFHTKLFGFLRSDGETSWYVGSANPSGSRRHEMMVRVGRKHKAIAAYAAAVMAKAIDVSADPPAEASRTLRSFFRSGFLAHKPPTSQLFTFDVFHFTAAERAKLDDGAGRRLGLRHANPKTEGYGFNLASAFGDATLQAADSGKSKRVQHSGSSVDTVFGFWMPGPYAGELRQKYTWEEAARERRLAAFGDKLCSVDGIRAGQDAFKDYLEDMRMLLLDRKVDKSASESDAERFKKFLTSRSRLLKDGKLRARHARIMVVQEMPDIWPDEMAASTFEESFFEGVSSRASSDTRKGRLIKLETANPEDIRDALEHRLAEKPWTDEDWGS
jgi:hypothetical protein